jgi:hypothetical protein
MKAHGGVEAYLLELDGGELDALAALSPQKTPLVNWIGRMGGPQNLSGCCGLDINFMSLPGIEPRPSGSQTTICGMILKGGRK